MKKNLNDTIRLFAVVAILAGIGHAGARADSLGGAVLDDLHCQFYRVSTQATTHMEPSTYLNVRKEKGPWKLDIVQRNSKPIFMDRLLRTDISISAEGSPAGGLRSVTLHSLDHQTHIVLKVVKREFSSESKTVFTYEKSQTGQSYKVYHRAWSAISQPLDSQFPAWAEAGSQLKLKCMMRFFVAVEEK